jgi:hypothetical protein
MALAGVAGNSPAASARRSATPLGPLARGDTLGMHLFEHWKGYLPLSSESCTSCRRRHPIPGQTWISLVSEGVTIAVRSSQEVAHAG